MTAATALFMIPTALIFPALLRKANTPPASITTRRTPLDRSEEAHAQVFMNNNRTVRQTDGRILDERQKANETQKARELPCESCCTGLLQRRSIFRRSQYCARKPMSGFSSKLCLTFKLGYVLEKFQIDPAMTFNN